MVRPQTVVGCGLGERRLTLPSSAMGLGQPLKSNVRCNIPPAQIVTSRSKGQAMLSATCHCGAVRVEIPEAPSEITNCSCSICRRLGALWAYYEVGRVKVRGHPEHTDTYIQGDKTLRVVRCKTCGCTTHWEPLDPNAASKLGVNVRNFDPAAIGSARMRMLDGANTWRSTFWEPPRGD